MDGLWQKADSKNLTRILDRAPDCEDHANKVAKIIESATASLARHPNEDGVWETGDQKDHDRIVRQTGVAGENMAKCESIGGFVYGKAMENIEREREAAGPDPVDGRWGDFLKMPPLKPSPLGGLNDPKNLGYSADCPLFLAGYAQARQVSMAERHQAAGKNTMLMYVKNRFNAQKVFGQDVVFDLFTEPMGRTWDIEEMLRDHGLEPFWCLAENDDPGFVGNYSSWLTHVEPWMNAQVDNGFREYLYQIESDKTWPHPKYVDDLILNWHGEPGRPGPQTPDGKNGLRDLWPAANRVWVHFNGVWDPATMPEDAKRYEIEPGYADLSRSAVGVRYQRNWDDWQDSAEVKYDGYRRIIQKAKRHGWLIALEEIEQHFKISTAEAQDGALIAKRAMEDEGIMVDVGVTG